MPKRTVALVQREQQETFRAGFPKGRRKKGGNYTQGGPGFTKGSKQVV